MLNAMASVPRPQRLAPGPFPPDPLEGPDPRSEESPREGGSPERKALVYFLSVLMKAMTSLRSWSESWGWAGIWALAPLP